MVLAKFFLVDNMTGIFQMIDLWIIYSAYATMHFCSVLIFFILTIFDLLFLNLDWNKMTEKNDDKATPIDYFVFSLIVIYNVFAIIFSYRIYGHYKTLFM